MSMQQQQKQRKIDEIKNYLNTAKWVDRTRKYTQSLKDGINTYNNYLNTPNTLKGATANNIMQPTQNMLSSTSPTLQNGTTSLANGFTSSAMPTTINSVGAGTGSGLTSLGGTSALNAGAGLSNAGLGTIGTAAASEASGAGGMGLASLGNIGANIATTAGGEALAGAGTGAGAALGGTTAAGAAGGAGAAGAGLAGAGTAALGALGSVAAPLAVGMFIWNMIDSARKKKQQKAMQMSQQAAAKTEGDAEQTTQQAMDKLQQGANEKKMELANLVNQGVAGNLPSLPNTPISQTAEPTQQIAMPNNTTGAAANISDGLNTANNTADITQNIMDMVRGDVPTSIQTGVPNDTINTPIADTPIVDTPVDQQNIQTGQVNETQDNRNLKQKIGGFLQEAGKGFNENNSTTISPENWSQNTYTTQTTRQLPHDEQVGVYADELARNGVKEDVINAFLNEGKNSGNKDIAEWVDAHQDLRNSDGSWKPSHVVENQEHKKGIGYRIGEALGTANRIASHPATQGLITMGAYMADGQTPWYSLGKGYEMASNKARSDAYRRMITGDNSASLFGGYSDKDLNAYTNQLYRDNMANYYRQKGETDKQRANTDEKYKEGMLNVNKQKANTDEKYKNGKLKIDQQNADTRSGMLGVAQQRQNTYAQKVQNDIKTKHIRPEDHPNYNSDLADFREAYSRAQTSEEKNKIVNKFISTYGIDPRQKIKDNFEEQ